MEPEECQSGLLKLLRSKKHWAHRGIARRILESDQDHLLPVAMKQLERGYQLCTYRRDQDDPLQLWMCGTGMIEANLGKVLRWVLTLQTGPEFNMALCDIVYPSLSSLCEVEEFESPDDKRNQLLLWIAQSPLLDPANPQTKRLIQALRDIEQPSHAVQLAYKCIDALPDKDEAILDLVLTAVDMFPPRQALEIIEPYETLLQSDRAKKVFAEQKAYVEGELRDAGRTVPGHWAMFDPAEPTQGRPDLYDQDAQLVVELGAAVSFLASPTGQSLLPFSQTKTLFGPRENEWPLTLKRLIQSRLLQVRRESAEGSFEMHEDQRFSWVPAHVELAVNLDSDDSQSGIILGLQNEIQEYVLHSTPVALLPVWQHLVSIEAHDYWISCMEYFRLPTHTLEDDEAHFQSAAALFSLSELMNLIYNVCQSAAGEQKARMLTNTHARNLAGSMLRSRMERAQAEGWTIKRGFRGELMPMSHLIQFFFTDFIPIGQETYECVVPNTGTLADAQEAMNQPQRGPSEPRV
ncbi:hypothetical protein [Hydrocarboniclastica marina]|uniref:Uncharacterized protein n=1 Tax=Hydrocarboniclastica marina TaxID=2259620 RepID=A0A4P7XMC9_9ALTE|nr:hypothetical protein [Hydrocarboniclastica marina]QCF28093.1 hypothetical protein soil367_18645 [Hydrocarboniclastica marina]